MDLEALMSRLSGRDNGSVADERVVDTGVGNQVGLELVQVDVEGTIESERRGDGANNLGNEAVKVLERGARNAEVATANVIDSLIIDEESAVSVLNGAVGGQDSVVRFNNSS